MVDRVYRVGGATTGENGYGGLSPRGRGNHSRR